MAEFKLSIADPTEKKTYKHVVKDDLALPLLGRRIGEEIDGAGLGLQGFTLRVTGGSDYCGFPMRKGINTPRKKVILRGGVGLRATNRKGLRRRKTVCGDSITDQINQVNLAVTKGKAIAKALGGESATEPEAKESPKKAEPKTDSKPETPKKIEPKAPKTTKEEQPKVKQETA